MKKVNILFIILFVLNGCRLPCYTSNDLEIVDEKPELNFLVGNYIVDYENKRGIDNTNKINLKLYADSTFILYNYPVGKIDLLDSRNDIRDTLKGNWKSNYLDLYDTASFRIYYNKNYGFNYIPRSWSVYKKENKAVLVIEFDDPDKCYYMRFVKQ